MLDTIRLSYDFTFGDDILKGALLIALNKDLKLLANITRTISLDTYKTNAKPLLYYSSTDQQGSFFRFPAIWLSIASDKTIQKILNNIDPLLQAIILNQLDHVTKLLNSEIKIYDEQNISALAYAAAQGNLDILNRLLEKKEFQEDLLGLEQAFKVASAIKSSLDTTMHEHDIKRYDKILFYLRNQLEFALALSISTQDTGPSLQSSLFYSFIALYPLFCWILNPLNK